MAMAPEQTGIGIRRHFTTPGVDPYDEVTWERRDARITNFRDGTVAFEQRDVEFPVTWSLNATNIVAQKYFRGLMGSPERETSLRQVIDRVADTVTAWGVKDGYFVDDEESEAFRAELKHLILHQKASFNSPVWFNIGVPNRPQQASACQPYDALVSTAEGLVPIGKLVETNAVGAKVLDASGATTIVAVKANGRRGVLRLHTKPGYSLDVTADHLVWRSEGDEPGVGRFVPAGRLNAGDKLEWHASDSWGNGEISRQWVAEAALAGWLQADGFVRHAGGRNEAASVELATVTAPEYHWVLDAVDAVGITGLHWSEREDTSGVSKEARRLALTSPGLPAFLDRWGLNLPTLDARVPEQVLAAPTPIVVAYLRSLFQAEGFVSTRAGRRPIVGLAMGSEGCVRGIQSLLLRFGIFSKIRFVAERRPDRRGAWVLNITAGDVRRFVDDIGFVDPAKAAELDFEDGDEAPQVSPTRPLEIVRIEPLGEMDVYDIQTESGEYLSGNIRVHNCFILAVEDTMQSILNWYVEEGTIFKGGSGAGINLSTIRSSQESLKGGGTASGPVSFMRGADASAGTIKSGGTTRRAAKMVILNADHPDVEDFIWCKAVEERKARVLRDAGFDMDLDGKDSHSTQYQNANNSVRVTDEFMQAVVDDADWHLREVLTGDSVKTVKAPELFRQIALATWECADPGMQFDTTINRWHTASNTGPITASNPCSEYMHVDNSACNLASLNLLKFLDDDTFDVDGFKAAVAVVFTAQEILVGNADYPTEKIAENSRRFRQLGLGYANLGAMLRAKGLPYDSDEGRAWASAITALMTGHAYATSARTAVRMGPFAGYSENREPMNRVLRMHRDELGRIDESFVAPDLLAAAHESWNTAVEMSALHGVRNSQASVLAPTGCLVGGSLLPTDHGLVRLRSLGDVDGAKWQELEAVVATDDGPRDATKFYVNGLEPVVRVETARGYSIQGTTQHRVRIVDVETGEWQWRRFADLTAGDLVPMALDQLVGEPLPVVLPPLGPGVSAENLVVNAELAELVGFFMGAGALRGDDLTLRVDASDFEVVERLERLGKDALDRSPRVSFHGVSVEVSFRGDDLVSWWTACDFDRRDGVAHIPDNLLASNDRTVYAGFLRGLFESDAMVTSGSPHWSTSEVDLARDVHSMLLALGYPAACKPAPGDESVLNLRLLDTANTARWLEEVGFVSGRKHAAVVNGHDRQAAVRNDLVPFTQAMVDRLVPCLGKQRDELAGEIERGGGVPRPVATMLFEETADPELGHLLSFFYDRVATTELGAEELTYDISVPENVTYIANGFVSHNTIGLMMDCDTTGIEPDLGLCKTKKLVGGGTMSIVNQTVPRALAHMGYSKPEADEIIAYIDEHKSILGAPYLKPEHVAVFACSMGDNVIHYLGHVKMMAAAQPWLSGAISKCLSGTTLIPTEDGLIRIGSLYDNEPADSFRDEIMQVASLGAVQKTDAFYYGGVRPVRKVVLRSGHKVIGTPNHRVLVGVEGGLEWKRLDEIEVGNYVATQYGSFMWSLVPPRFDDFRPGTTGGRNAVTLPTEMTEELAFLLGAYASEGCTTGGSAVHITNSVDSVIQRVIAAWRSLFGFEPRVIEEGRNGCPDVVVNSKTVAEFFEYLGMGKRASTKRIPDAVLRSPYEIVLAFLQGLALDAYATVLGGYPKWAICLDSPELLDDLQAVLTNLGIVHGRISKLNKDNGKTYDEVYAVGADAQQLVTLVPFMEPDKQRRATELRARVYGNHNTADIVPGLTPRELYDMLPYRQKNAAGRLLRTEFRFLHDGRSGAVARTSLERVAAVPGSRLAPWLQSILDDNLHFSPVESVGDAGECEVYDLSVPSTHAFVGNGIVNHNTINMPEEATVEEVEQLHIDAWQMGLKAVAIYRDNCKVAQPLSNTKKAVAELVHSADELAAAVRAPVREKLPRTRSSKTFSFRVADCHGYVTVGEYDDGRPGEIFLRVAKQGSTLAGIMDAFAISVSHGLQYGVPLRAFIDMYTNMRFEPAGMTDDPDLRFASSLVDYIFRRLAVEYLPYEDRADLGILTVGERTQPTLPGVEEDATPSAIGSDVLPDPVVAPVPVAPAPAAAAAPTPVAQPAASDAPYCYQCGMVMQRAGACFVCSSCGTTSGCS
ncbi:MAG TPA: LAGLIDADG family homing endonuclease [Acidimicrobiales bacterium]|nr:LAGLIDADG family homing endonuclease [Acidimicrobiales bacterium]